MRGTMAGWRIAALVALVGVVVLAAVGCGGEEDCTTLPMGSVERAECDCGLVIPVPDYLPADLQGAQPSAGCDDGETQYATTDCAGKHAFVTWTYSGAAVTLRVGPGDEPPRPQCFGNEMKADEVFPTRFEVVTERGVEVSVPVGYGNYWGGWSYKGKWYSLDVALPRDSKIGSYDEGWKVFHSIVDELGAPEDEEP